MKMIDHNHFICHLILGTFTEYPYVMNELTNWHLKDIADKIWYAGESIMKVSEKHLKI